MIYNTISSKVCIARVFDRFNINYSGFIPRVASWIIQCMKELDIIQSLQNIRIDDTVVDYKCLLPLQTIELLAVEYEDLQLRDIGAYSPVVSMFNRMHPTETYELTSGYIITSFEEGDISFYVKTLPIEFDNELKLYFPTIPDNEDVLIALDWYIIKRLIERGHVIKPFDLTVNNEFINPGLAYEKQKRIARNSMAHISHTDREEISVLLKTFILDYGYNRTTLDLNTLLFDGNRPSVNPDGTTQEGERITGVHAGKLGEMSLTDDYAYICVKGGPVGTAIWKQFVLFKTAPGYD